MGHWEGSRKSLIRAVIKRTKSKFLHLVPYVILTEPKLTSSLGLIRDPCMPLTF